MAVSIGTWYGAPAGPTSKFRVVSQLRYTDKNDTGAFVQRRQYVEVTVGASYTWVSILNVSWNKTTRYALKDVGVYADSGWKDVGWIGYGESVDYGCNAYYKGGSGTTYKSELTGTHKMQLPTYTITFNANGGANAPSAVNKLHGNSINLPTATPKREGYTFSGWSKSSTGAVAYQPGSAFAENSNVTLYAVWTRVTYTIKYNANGGTGAPAEQMKQYGVSIKLSEVKPIKEGYAFSGWARRSTGSAAYQPGSTFAENANVTLYAVWTLQANCYIKESGVQRAGMMYVRENGTYKTGQVEAKKDGIYKNSII